MIPARPMYMGGGAKVQVYTVSPSNRSGKKFMACNEIGRCTHFGAEGYSDYPHHRDETRKASYIARHGGGRENWSSSGIDTPGFWSRWLLWNKPTLEESAADIETQFGVKVVLKR